jgi:Bacterial Ig domain
MTASGTGDLTSQPMTRSRSTPAALRLRIAKGVVVVAVCVQLAVGINTGLAGGRSDYAGQVQDARVVVNIRKASNGLLGLTGAFFEPTNEIRQLAEVAANHRLSIFNNSGLVAQYAKEGLPVESTPITTVIYPPNGSRLKGTQALFASASGEYGLSNVEFEITGGRLRDFLIGTAADSGYGWYQAWNTTSVPDGAYILQSVAYGAAGKMGRSKGTTVRVAN